MRLTQVEVSQKAAELGERQHRDALEGALARGSFSRTRIGGQLRDYGYARLVEEIKTGLEEMSRMRRGASAILSRPCASAEHVAAAGICAVLDSIVKRISFAEACRTVGGRIDDETRFLQFRSEHPAYWEEVERTMSTGKTRRRRAILRRLSTRFIGIEPASSRERAKAGLFVLSRVLRATRMFALEKSSNGRGGYTKVFAPTKQTERWIKRALEHEIATSPYFMPSVVPARDWTSPTDGGWPDDSINLGPMIGGRWSEFLSEIEDRRPVSAYRAMNLLQRVAWRVDLEMLAFAREIFVRRLEIGGHPSSAFPEPVPENVSATREELWLARHMEAVRARRVRAMKSKRVRWGRSVATAAFFGSQEFYYPVNLDFRGRVVMRAARFCPNGSDHQIAMLRFDRSQRLRAERDWFWVENHGFNLFAPFKGTFDARRKWVAEHAREIEASADDPYDCRWWERADKPMSFLAWARQYMACRRSKSAEWSIPCMVDGVSNALQILALMLRDQALAGEANCVDTGGLRDIYQGIADDATETLAKSGSPLAGKWLEHFGGRIPRAVAKPVGRDIAGGARKYAAVGMLRDWWDNEGGDKFGVETRKAVMALVDALWESASRRLASAIGVGDWMRGCSRALSAAGVQATWISPSNLFVSQNYHQSDGRYIIRLTLGRKVNHVTSTRQSDKIDRRRAGNGIVANVVASIESGILHLVVARLGAAGVKSLRTVHDGYGGLPGDMDLVSRAIREVYAEVFVSDPLHGLYQWWQSILTNGKALPEPPARGSLDPQAVLSAPYLFS